MIKLIFISLLTLIALAFNLHSTGQFTKTLFQDKIKTEKPTSADLQKLLDQQFIYICKEDSLQILKKRHAAELNKLHLEVQTLNKEKTKIRNTSLKDTINRIDDSKIQLKISRIDSQINELNDLASKHNNDLAKINGDIKEVIKQIDKLNNSLVKEGSKVYHSYKIKHRGSHYYVFVSNTTKDVFQLHWLNKKNNKGYTSIQNVHKQLIDEKLNPLLITNAGMYTPELAPQGLYVEDYKEYIKIDTTKPNSNNFYLKPNGVFYIDSLGFPKIDTTELFYTKYKKGLKPKYATQSGPMLLINGRVHQDFTYHSSNKKIRNGIGIIEKNKIVICISIDEVNFYDFALLFKEVFGCKDAMFLDGAISRMYLNDLNPKEKGGQFGPIISISSKQ
jgi:uncharacterized protein YigE (DUF2233 family)